MYKVALMYEVEIWPILGRMQNNTDEAEIKMLRFYSGLTQKYSQNE